MTIDKIKENISVHNMINEGDTVIVGLSGGYDSVMLLDILDKIQDEFRFNIVVAHVNHGVRGEEAYQDQLFAEKTAKSYGADFFVKEVNMEKYAAENKMSDEEAGRELRYGFFRQIASKYGKYKIAVAHNKNDQAETVLMRIMRGTGLDGLKGIEYVNGDIIRPILNISRAEVEEYCKENSLNPRLDRTNLETIYNRNKIRLELIPYIQENFNNNIIETLFRLSEQISAESNYLNRTAEKEFEYLLIENTKHKIDIDNKKLLRLEEALKARVLRVAIKKLLGNIIGLEEKHIRMIINLSERENTGKMIELPNKVKIKLNYDKLSIEKSEIKSKVRYNYKITTNQVLKLKEIGASIRVSLGEIETFDLKKNKYTEYFDYDTIDGEMFIRNRQDGDRIKFFGSAGTKKLKDYFIDEKIPREQRDKIPIFVIGDKLAWIVGFRRGDISNITGNTKRVLKIEYAEKE